MLKLLERFRPGRFAVSEDFVCPLPPEHTQDDFDLLERHKYGKSETNEAETSQAERAPRPKVLKRASVAETKSPEPLFTSSQEPPIMFSKVEPLGVITKRRCPNCKVP